MPPKKKGGKGKKKDAGAEDAEAIGPEHELAKVLLHVEALERELVTRRENEQRAVAAMNELRQRVLEYDTLFDNERSTTFDITSDMTRQYKAMQEELLGRINVLENTIAELTDQLELSRIALEETKKEKDQIIALKEAEIAEQKQKMEDMAAEFGEMLKETLDKMGDRIELASNNWEAETSTSLLQKLDEFNFKDSEI
eukprot:GFYU01005224.1.p1 GENE.GFYU01005224.1~~GFYU01005224.1.p1  ORF type:complete len:198 (+),score=86.75 GFYU01005224.1:213-806(+)